MLDFTGLYHAVIKLLFGVDLADRTGELFTIVRQCDDLQPLDRNGAAITPGIYDVHGNEALLFQIAEVTAQGALVAGVNGLCGVFQRQDAEAANLIEQLPFLLMQAHAGDGVRQLVTAANMALARLTVRSPCVWRWLTLIASAWNLR